MARIQGKTIRAGFGERLRQLRLAAKLSQEELALAAGLDRTYVSSCERGHRNVTLETIGRLADALSVDPAALVRRLTKPEQVL